MTARFATHTISGLAALALLWLPACGDDGGTAPIPAAPDAASPADASPPPADTAGPTPCENRECGTDPATGSDCGSCADGQTCSEAGICEAPADECDERGFTRSADQVGYAQQGVAVYEAVLANGADNTFLNIEIYETGDWDGAPATQPGVYDLGGSNYASCANCALVYADCNQQGCDRIFYATEGILTIEAYGEGNGFKGTLSGAVLQEVTIDQQSFESTVVRDGATWCIDDYAFDAPWQAPEPLPTHTGTVSETCVPDGTGKLIGANIANYTLQNCLGESVSLHDACGTDARAMWLFSTAGWCTACTARLADLAGQVGGTVSRAAIAANTPGLDMLILLAENNEGEKPTEAFCMQYAESRNLDPAMVLIDWNDAGTPIAPINMPDAGTFNFNSLGYTWGAIEPYIIADSNGYATNLFFPWDAILRATNMEYLWSASYSETGFEDARAEALATVVPGPDPLGNLVEVATDAGDFSVLLGALDAAGLTPTIANGGPFTVFAPTDTAVAAALNELGMTAEELLADTELLTNILKYHVVEGTVLAEDVVSLESATTLQGCDITIAAADGVVTLNDTVTVTGTDVMASNGVIHVIDAVLLPPAEPCEEPEPPLGNLVEVAGAAGDFTILAAALEAAGLTDTIATGGPFTVFAPTDAAFAAALTALDLTQEELLADTALLTSVLTYHVVDGTVLAADVVTLESATTLQGCDIAISYADEVVTLNDTVTVTGTDVLASNGVIHVIDAVLLPPTEPCEEPEPPLGNLVEVAGAAGDFTILAAALEAAGLTDTIATGGIYTIFAPTDEAFEAALVALGKTQEELFADTDLLTSILTYHVVVANLVAADVVQATSVTTLEGSEIAITVGADGNVVLNGSVNVTSVDVMATNGVIHVIDAVLLPPAEPAEPTVHTVSVGTGMTFSPAELTIAVGDIVSFDLGGYHNALEVSQETWESNGSTPLDGGFFADFSATPVEVTFTEAGMHYYVCVPHSSMGMKGTITVE